MKFGLIDPAIRYLGEHVIRLHFPSPLVPSRFTPLNLIMLVESTMDSEDISTSIPTATPPAMAQTVKPSFMTLPTELHLLISQHLTYPDALSLKHTNAHFYNLVYTGIHLKIEWLIERRRLHLDCPNDKKCELGSDMRFCRGSVQYVLHSCELRGGGLGLFALEGAVAEEVANELCRLLMKRRREHGECEAKPGGRGCLVLGTPVCAVRREKMAEGILKKIGVLVHRNRTVWWVLVALIGIVVAAVGAWEMLPAREVLIEG